MGNVVAMPYLQAADQSPIEKWMEQREEMLNELIDENSQLDTELARKAVFFYEAQLALVQELREFTEKGEEELVLPF